MSNTDSTTTFTSAALPPLIARQDAPTIVPVSLPTIDRAIKRGDLRVTRIGRRIVIPTAELLRWAGIDQTGQIADPEDAA
ncbi:MAG: helix-turn-helix domain-containing protein [Acidimicrobiales bacterium]|nr:helix-turn-helix domain-containing protein [Acidimicrobiales bacterium]